MRKKREEKEKKRGEAGRYLLSLLIRVFLCFIPVSLITSFFLGPTIYGSALLLSFYKPVILGNVMFVGGYVFTFIEACVAGYAYYMLLLLMLLTKDIIIWKRAFIIIFGSALVYLMNVLRIALLGFIAVNYGVDLFEAVHLVFWYFVSGIYVALVWILLVKIFGVRSIPIYSDLQYLYRLSLFSKKNKK